MTERTNEVLADLAATLGVHGELMGLDDEQREIVAIRLITETGDTPSAGALRKIAREVKLAGTEGTRSSGSPLRERSWGPASGKVAPSKASVPADTSAAGVHGAADGGRRSGQATDVEEPSGPATSQEPALRRPRYLATEATTRREKDRLATIHRIEDRRTGLFLAPRRPRKPLHPFAVHPACKAAHADGGVPCGRCAPLLHDADCTCPDCDAFWEAQP